MPRRRALLLVSAFALFSWRVFPVEWASDCAAAPVPAAPKADDSTSASATKLLEHRKIQKELKLSAEQRIVILDGLADIDDDYSDKLNELSRQPNPNDTDYEKLDKERQKQVDKLLTDTAARTLTAAQRVRLQQFDYRLRGPAAFADPRVEKKLQLTAAQKKTAADAAERLKGELERYLDGGDGNEDEPKRKADLFAFRAARLKDVITTLTADQKTAWEAMLGDAPTGFVADELWLKIEEEMDLQISLG